MDSETCFFQTSLNLLMTSVFSCKVLENIDGFALYWKAFAAKLAVDSDIKIGSFYYLKNLKNLSADPPVNSSDLQGFSIRFKVLQHSASLYFILIRPDTFKYSELDASLFEWMEINLHSGLILVVG